MAVHRWEPCKTWQNFYWLWLKVAMTHAWSLAEIVGFALLLLVPLVAILFPEMHESSLAPPTWEIAVGVLAVVGFVRLLCASYWIYRDRHQRANDRESVLIADVAERNETITALITKPKRTPAA
jgi:membrane protein implicated in regulation of membrane protease activity